MLDATISRRISDLAERTEKLEEEVFGVCSDCGEKTKEPVNPPPAPYTAEPFTVTCPPKYKFEIRVSTGEGETFLVRRAFPKNQVERKVGMTLNGMVDKLCADYYDFKERMRKRQLGENKCR